MLNIRLSLQCHWLPDSIPSQPRHALISQSTAAKRRLIRDFKRLANDPPVGISGSPNSDNIMIWNAVIFGPRECLLKSLIIHCSVILFSYNVQVAWARGVPDHYTYILRRMNRCLA